MIRRSTLALVVLALLFEAPMHPYRMPQLIKKRGKDRVIFVGQRASPYKTIDWPLCRRSDRRWCGGTVYRRH